MKQRKMALKQQPKKEMDLTRLTLGFLGCGKISSALCRGFAGLEKKIGPKSIVVTYRSPEKSAALLEEFPELIHVAEANEEVVAQADVVFIGLLPNVAREVLPVMPWKDNQLVISMMAAVNYEETCALIPLDRSHIVRIVPLPSAARRCGPILQYPRNEMVNDLLQVIGTPIPCANEDQMKPMIALTGHISSFFELMRTSQQFLVEKGIDERVSRDFVTSFYHSLAKGTAESDDTLHDMAVEAATPGGLNAQSMEFLCSSDHFYLHSQSLQAILDRLSR